MALPVADLIVENGPIWCGANDGIAEAVAIWQGHVLATGTKAEIASLAGRGTRRIDLGGRLATPGLNDSHLHLVALGLTMGWVDARPAAAPTLETLLARIGERARTLGPGKWVLARGYDQTKLDVLRHPLRDELDRAAPDNPVVLVRTCGHISIASSKALALAGIDERSPVPQGGLIEQRDGRLTGLLAENARLPLTKAHAAAGGRRARRRHRAWRQVPAVLRHHELHGRRRRPSRRLRRDRRLPEGEAHRPPAGPHLADPARRSRRRHRRQGARRRPGLRHRRRHADDRRGQDLPRRLGRRPHRLDVEALPRRRRDLRRCHAARQRAHRPGAGLSRQGLSARLPRHRRRGDRAADQRLREGARRHARSRPPASHRALRILDAGPAPAHARGRHLSLPAAGLRLRLRRRLCVGAGRGAGA